MPPGPELHVAPDTLTAGGNAQVSITNGPPNSSVTVTITNGGGEESSLVIGTDATGAGSEPWEVPAAGWDQAHFNADGCEEVMRDIEPGE